VTSTQTLPRERADLIQTLDKHRAFLRYTARNLTDEQATQRPTASALTIAGVIKHVAETETSWTRFIEQGPGAFGDGSIESWMSQWELQPGETLAGVLAHYEEVARRTDELIARIPDLDADHPLPPAPWFEKGARWSVRRVLVHILAETAQHAGHADILRESIDGQKTMG
jgi:uncharacterized damage-inducible protein DinB